MVQVRFSIVMPNRNCAAYIETAIQSILAAAKGIDLEYIFVDGASTDGSTEIAARYSERFACWISEPDEGQYEAVNKGFNRATGEILGWLNSDDLYFPWTLSTVGSVFQELPDVDWLTTTSPGAVDADGLGVRVRTVPGYAAEAFFEGRYIPAKTGWSYGAIQQESTFFRRSLWNRAGGGLNTAYRLAADFELWSRFFEHAELCSTETPLAAYRYRSDQRGANLEAYMGEVFRCLSGRQRESRLRQIALRPWTRALPGIGRALAGTMGYSGRKLIRQDGRWVSQGHRFY